MIKNDIHRENSRRQHRSVALFLVMQCWLRGTDSIEISKSDLRVLLGLSRIEEKSREEWIKEDFGEFFFYVKNGDATIVLSRRKEDLLRLKPILQYEEIKEISELQSVFDENGSNLQESYISCYLSLLTQGQISPKSMSISNRNIEFELYKGNLLYDYYRNFVDKCFQKNLGEFKFYNDLPSSRKHTPRMSNANLKELEILFGELFSKYRFNEGFIHEFFGITQEMYFAKDEETEEITHIILSKSLIGSCQLVSQSKKVSGLVPLQSLKIVAYSSLSVEERNNLGWQNGVAFWDLPKKLQFQAFNDLRGREFVRFIKANVEKFKERGYLD